MESWVNKNSFRSFLIKVKGAINHWSRTSTSVFSKLRKAFYYRFLPETFNFWSPKGSAPWRELIVSVAGLFETSRMISSCIFDFLLDFEQLSGP